MVQFRFYKRVLSKQYRFHPCDRKSSNGRETTTSVLSMGQAYIACFRNTRICKLQAICGTPRVRTERHISSENLGNIPIHFVCQLLVVGNMATNTGTEMQQSQTLWQAALKNEFQMIANIAQYHLKFHSVVRCNRV